MSLLGEQREHVGGRAGLGDAGEDALHAVVVERGVEARRQRQAAKLAWLTTAIERCDADERRTLVDAIALIQRLGES